MNDIRKLLDIINETTAGATASGGVAPVSQSMHTQRRVEEDYSEESSDKPQMPQILEYGNWENSALTTSKKLKKSRKKASKIVKSVYGEDMPGEKVRVTESFGPLPKDNQQIRLGKYTVDIKRVGLNKNYIGFAWHDSKGQEHYEEVAVGDLGSYDDLLARIKGEIRYQERRLRQGVAEGSNSSPFDQMANLKSKSNKELDELVKFWQRALEKNPDHKVANDQLHIIKMIRAERIGKKGVAEGLAKDIKRLATGKDVKSRAEQEISKAQQASMTGDNKTAHKHFKRYDKLDKLANKEQDVAEGSENQYSVKHDHPTNKNKYAFSTISAPDIKTAKKLANEKFDGVVSVQRLIKQQFAMEGVAEGQTGKPIKPGRTFRFPNHWNKADVVHEFLWKKNAVVDVEYSYDTKKWTVTDSRPATEKDMEQWATINGGLPTVNEQGVAEGYKNTYEVGDRVNSPLGTGTITAVSKNVNVDGKVLVKLDDPSQAGEDGKHKDTYVLTTTQLTHISDVKENMTRRGFLGAMGAAALGAAGLTAAGSASARATDRYREIVAKATPLLRAGKTPDEVAKLLNIEIPQKKVVGTLGGDYGAILDAQQRLKQQQ